MKKPYINVLKELPYIQNDLSSGFDPGGTAANAPAGAQAAGLSDAMVLAALLLAAAMALGVWAWRSERRSARPGVATAGRSDRSPAP